MQCNLRSPAKAPVIFLGLLRLKRGQRKRKHSRKDCQKVTDLKVYACPDSDLSEVLYHYIIFWTKKIGIFGIRFIALPWVEFPKICWTVKHIRALSSAC